MIRKTKLVNKLDSFSQNSSIGIVQPEIDNDRQIVFGLARDLVRAQFVLGDVELANRLWQDVADRDIEFDRIINLMYGCSLHADDEAMLEADLAYAKLKL